MLYSTYLRIESQCGGVTCSEREFIRAARKVFDPRKRDRREYRVYRHAFYREGLEYLREAQDVYRSLL